MRSASLALPLVGLLLSVAACQPPALQASAPARSAPKGTPGGLASAGPGSSTPAGAGSLPTATGPSAAPNGLQGLPAALAGRPVVSAAAAGLGLASDAALTGKVKLPTGLIGNNGGSLIGNNGGSLISDKGGAFISDQGGGVVSQNGGAIVAKNGAPYRLLAGLEQAPAAGKLVYLLDAAGHLLADAAGRPLSATTGPDGSYRFDGLKPGRNLVAVADLGASGLAQALVPRATGAVVATDLDLISTLTTGYILEQYVRPQADPLATLDKLPAAVEADTRAKALQAFEAGGVPAPAALSVELVTATVASLRRADAAFDAQVEVVRKLLVVGAASAAVSDGPALAAVINPSAVACDPAGNVYFTDQNLVRVLRPDGTVRTLAGSGSAGYADGVGAAARFNRPTSVAVDRAGTLYVADLDNSRVRTIAPDGTVRTLAGGCEAGAAAGSGRAACFEVPAQLAVDADGTVYVADSVTETLWAIAPGGATRKLATNLAASFLAVGADGQLYLVEDGETTRISRLDPRAPGQPRTTLLETEDSLGSGGLAVDAGGTVFLADTFSGRLYKLAPGQTPTQLAGSPAGGRGESSGDVDGQGLAARFNWPSGLALDGAGNLFVADSLNFKLRRLAPDGRVTTVAGTGISAVDGGAAQAIFARPTGLAWDPAGNLFVADGDGGQVRKIAPDGTVSTFAGSGRQGDADGQGVAASFGGLGELAIDAARNLWVLDGQALRKIAPDGTVSTPELATGSEAPAFFGSPSAIAIDPAGVLQILDEDFDTNEGILIRVGTADLSYRVVGPSGRGDVRGGVKDGRLYFAGVAVDPAGTLYVADAGARVIRKLAPGQAPVIWVGSGDEGDADGRGRAASFSLPTGITRDRAGNLYVADLGSNRVRRVTPDGVVSTVPLQLPPGAALVGPIAVSDTTLAVAAGTQILKVPVPRLTAGQTP